MARSSVLAFRSVARVVVLRILLALAGILLGLFGLAINASEIFPSTMTVSATNPVARGLPDALLYFWTFFTHLTNLWLLLTYAAVLSGWRGLGWFARPVMMASAAAFITLVMLYFHFMLAPTLNLAGGLALGSYALHYATPLIYLVWWTLYAPHGSLRFGQLPLLLLPGVGYVAWVLMRGAVVNEYPYDILDAGKFGYGAVAIGVAALLVAVLLFSIVIVFADRRLGRPRGAG